MNNKRKKSFILFASICMMLVLATACSEKVSVPDEYNYDDLSKYITLGEYKGLKYEKIDVQVTESEIQETIDEQLAQTTESKKVESGTVKEDSVINIDYSGAIDGEKFDGGTAEGQELNMADNNFIDGFSDGILGHKVGETFDIDVTFPENYGSDELAGKDAVFTIKVNYIIKTVNPTYNEEWVKNNTDFKSCEEYEKSIKEDLMNTKKEDALSTQRTDIFNQILEKSKVVEYPQKELDARKNAIINSYKGYAKQNDLEFEQYLSEQMGMTEKEFDAQAEETAKLAVKQELVLHAIAEKEGIKITDSDYQEYIDNILEESGYTAKTFKEENGYSIVQYAESKSLYSSLLYQKVMDKVMEYSVAK